MPDINHTAIVQNPARRRLLNRAASAAALMLLPGLPALARDSRNNAKAGLQLYTVRELMQQSVADTLTLVAGIGYQEVEFAGYFGKSAAEIKALLDSNGLLAPSVHVSLQQLRSELPAVINDAKTIGHRYIVLPWLSEEQRGDGIDSYKKLAGELNGFAKPIRDAGLQLCYHNHDFELIPVKGGLPYAVLLGETDADLVKMELDVFWAIKAGVEPLQLFARYPGRFPLLHIKDMTKDGSMADVGRGVIDFKPIFAQAAKAGVQHQFVEHDNPLNQIETLSQGYKALTALLNGAIPAP